MATLAAPPADPCPCLQSPPPSPKTTLPPNPPARPAPRNSNTNTEVQYQSALQYQAKENFQQVDQYYNKAYKQAYGWP